ncbi:MAG: CtsR family transcriptional regulator [Clostridiales bacterium]|jgi:transcriptional regulator CtsR|nr:CtsR family transcriptional regulator [Clostridiales bacterium]
MSNRSDIIESFILDIIGKSGEAVINRNDLAGRFDCASSQINYVLNTRFTSDKGYSIESRRGGGGYIRLFRMNDSEGYFKALAEEIKAKPLSFGKCEHNIERLVLDGVISVEAGEILESALTDKALKGAEKPDLVRSDIFYRVVEGLWKRRSE